jgi:5'-phosphate synthase pdxT subunit
MGLRAGVVAVQGDVAEHADAIERAATARGRSVEVVPVRESGVVPDCDLLAMPGGESTTISRHLHREGIAPEVEAHVAAGRPLLATCAGLIVAARDARDDRVEPLGLVDATVDRNAFGRQRDSFETHLDVTGLDDPVPAVFIRAPAVADVGPGVEVLAEYDGRVVAVREGPVVATAFHPELTPDTGVHGLAFFSD